MREIKKLESCLLLFCFLCRHDIMKWLSACVKAVRMFAMFARVLECALIFFFKFDHSKHTGNHMYHFFDSKKLLIFAHKVSPQ